MKRIFLLIVFLICMSHIYSQTTITVGSGAGYDYSTIQDAISAAEFINGSVTITVSNGTYYSTDQTPIEVDLDENDVDETIILISEEGYSNCTILGNGVPTLDVSGSLANLIVDGFTINGTSNGDSGISLSTSTDYNNIWIKNCVIQYCEHGIEASYASEIEVDNCIIKNNEAISGAGIYISGGASINIHDCTIEYNDSNGNTDNDGGGGIACFDGSSNIGIANNVIRHNTSDSYGGGIQLSSVAKVEYNSIENNDAVYGGGISVWAGTNNVISNNTIEDNDATYGGGIYSKIVVSIEENTIQNNNAFNLTLDGYGGGVYIENWNSSTQELFDNNLLGNSADNGGGIYLLNSNTKIYGGLIRSNTATLCGGGIYAYHSNPSLEYIIICSNIASNVGGVCIEDDNDISVPTSISVSKINHCDIFANLELNEQFSGGLYAASEDNDSYTVINCYNSIIYNNFMGQNPPTIRDVRIDAREEQDANSNIKYDCFTNGIYIHGPTEYVNQEYNINDNPLFVDAINLNFELTWSSTQKSPCIDTGDPNSSLDPDDTRADMGALYCDHDEKTYSFTVPQGQQTGIKWLSFDILDPTNATTNNQVQYFLEDIQDDLHNGEHEGTVFSFNVGPPPFWTNGDVLVTSPRGFKIRVSDDVDLDVSGFRCPANTLFDIVAQDDWIGYFLEDSQHIYDAFDGYLDDISSITHQDWSVRNNGSWPDVSYTLSAGDMVIIKLRSTIEDFSWPVPERTEPFIVLEPILYTFTEEMEYIPIYIDLNENDLPDEIGVFLDGDCVGARVVQHEFENVCTYISEAQSGEIEFEFAYYERGTRERFKEYTVYDEETGYRETTTINLDNNKQDYYYISFNSNPGSNSTPHSNELTISNSPNPFNPSTSISYNLPIEDNINLSIFNLKGQIVKVIAEGTQPAGEYNAIWDGTDSTGKSVSSGVYFYTITTTSKTINKKMLLLK